MKNPKSLLFLSVILAVLLWAGRVSAATFSDGTFNLSDWTLVVELANGPVVADQVLTGGNPSEFRTVLHSNFTFDLRAFHYLNSATYNPASGAIGSINWSEDEIAIINHSGSGPQTGVGVAVALQQSGKNYYSSLPFHVTDIKTSWTSYSDVNLTALNFRTFTSAADHPDFSTLGGLMQFGFVTANQNDSNVQSRKAGFDNWSVTLNPIPEPAALPLLALGLAASRFLRRRPQLI